MTPGPEPTTPKDIFLASLARCEASADFVHRFYRRFLASSDDVSRLFRHTDFKRQERMLRLSLELSAKATVGDPTGIQELQARVETHARLPISPVMYDLWLASAMATARECDPRWSAEVEDAWRTILGFIVRRMTRSGAPRPAVERRKAPRLMLALGGTWRLPSSADGTPCLIAGVNPGGCSIYSSGSHPIGSPIEVTLTATGCPPVILDGRVVHTEFPNGFGVAFEKTPPERAAELASLLAALKARGATDE